MTVTIKGFPVQIDEDDYALVMNRKWGTMRNGKTPYFSSYVRVENGVSIYDKLHRLIVGLKYGDPRHVDHINGDTLDNRKANLRVCTHRENLINTKRRSDNTSGFRGVSWSRKRQKWVATIHYNGKGLNLGGFNDPKEAYAAYCEKAKELFGEFARL